MSPRSPLLSLSIAFLAASGALSADPPTLYKDGAAFAAKKFDYVVIGGGTGGLSVAARLSEDPNLTVGVIESGEYRSEDDIINVAGLAGFGVGDDRYDWKFLTTPQEALNGRRVDWARGKALGGSSALNYMAMTRGSKWEYNQWGQIGNPGWGWDRIFKYALKVENLTAASAADERDYYSLSEPQYHGKDGPVRVGFPKWTSDIIPVFYRTLAKLGIPPNPDGTSGNTYGAWSTPHAVNLDTNTRVYAANAFYADVAASRPNYIVLTGAHATRIELSDKPNNKGDYTATRVHFHKGGQNFSVAVNKEVIVSGGVVQTPQILELSGIGDPSILSKFGIQTKINLPAVGSNLQDHLQTFATLEIKPEFHTRDKLADPAFLAEQMELYKQGLGILTSSLGTLAYLPFQHFIPPQKYSKYKRDLDAEIAGAQGLNKITFDVHRKILDHPLASHLELIAFPSPAPGWSGAAPLPPDVNHLTLSACTQFNFARGTIHIQSSDPLVPPAINPRYATTAWDKNLMREGLRYLLTVAQSEPLKSNVVRIIEPALNSTDAELDKYIQDRLVGQLHPCCTAPMMPKNKGGVVDTKLKVYGTTNIRISDASLWPVHMAVHPMQTVYAISGYLADVIKGKA